MKKYLLFLNAVANKEIKFHLLDNPEEIKDEIADVVDKFAELVSYNGLNKKTTRTLVKYGVIDNEEDFVFIYDYNTARYFLLYFLPFIHEYKLFDEGHVKLFENNLNDMEKLYDKIYWTINSKMEMDNNLKLF